MLKYTSLVIYKPGIDKINEIGLNKELTITNKNVSNNAGIYLKMSSR